MFWNNKNNDLQQRIDELEQQLAEKDAELSALHGRQTTSVDGFRVLLQQYAHQTAEITHFADLGESLDTIRRQIRRKRRIPG